MRSSPNAQQIEYWNGAVGERWAALQERIDLSMTAITDALFEFARPEEGERALDIGCGCGTTTLRLALQLAASGSAAGLDISAPMLAVARARAQAQNADIPFLEADAASHDLQPVFDLVFSRFGVMFFADPVAAFANIRKALVRGGRMTFACWRSLPENLWAYAPYAAAGDLLPRQEMSEPHAPGPFAFADGERLHDILAQAGFRGIEIETFDGAMNMGVDLEDAAVQALNIGPLARAAAELDEAARDKIRVAVIHALAPYKTAYGVALPAACWFVRARP